MKNFNSTLMNATNFIRLLIKALTGKDPGTLERVLRTSAGDFNSGNPVDYYVYEDESLNFYSVGLFHYCAHPEECLKSIAEVTSKYLIDRYGHCPPHFSYTSVALMENYYPNLGEIPHREHEYVVPIGLYSGNPAIEEMCNVLLDNEPDPITELGKAVLQVKIEVEGEEWLELVRYYNSPEGQQEEEVDG